MKKQTLSLFIFLSAALFITTLLTSCPSDLKTIQPGYVRLELGGISNLRTILPTDVTVSSFLSYNVAFTAQGTGTTFDQNIAATNIGNPIQLDPGTYNLVVTAFMDAGSTQPAAEFRQNSITIGSNTAAPTITVLLEAISPVDGTEDGTFSWDIDITGINPLTAAGMVIDTFPPGGTQTPVNLAANLTGTQTLPAGYYTVEFTITSGSDSIVFRQALWIYQHLTSQFNFTFTQAHFGMETYTVTFESNGGTAVPSTQVMSGGTITPGDPTRNGWKFHGWFPVNDTWTNEFTSTTPVTSNLTLYARWAEDIVLAPDFDSGSIGGTSIMLSVTVNSNTEPFTANSIPINTDDTIAITVTNASVYSNIEWKWNDSTPIGTGDVLTLDTTSPISYLISVEATQTSGGAPQSAFFTVVVSP